MEIIEIGNVSFNAKTLRIIDKKEAIATFKNINKSIVSQAWDKANPRAKKRPKKRKTTEE